MASTYSGEIPSMILKKTTKEVINDTCTWLKWIASDNSFHYGYTSKDKKINAHHNGCYFCGTNVDHGSRSKKGIVDYKKTYCCNPYAHAGWAHGGGVTSMLKICRSGSSFDFVKGSGYDKSKLFSNLGHISMKKLRPGDVLCNDHHVSVYVGDGYICEASSGDDNKRGSKKWNSSIHKVKLTSKMYKNYKRVHRFKGIVNASRYLSIGEVSYRVKQLQKFLNWFGGYKLTVDGKFGDGTKKAVMDFQKKVGLQADGKFGTNSIRKAKAVKK